MIRTSRSSVSLDMTAIGVGPALRTEEVGCSICGHATARRLYSERYELRGQSARLGINRCRQCRQVYVSPRLDRRSTEMVYRYDQQHTISHHYCWTGESSNVRFEGLLNWLSDKLPHGRLLDVGCGGGHFLSAAARLHRWELTGIEPNRQAAEAARQLAKCPVHCATLETAPLGETTFDAIAMLGVLEHLHDPLTTLQVAAQRLRPGGLMLVYVPNFHYLRLKDTGLVARCRFGKPSRLAPQEHLFHFTPTTLNRLLSRAGFDPIELAVGRPFLKGSRLQRSFKQLAFAAADRLFRQTGIHLGGIEVMAERRPDDVRPIPADPQITGEASR